MAGTLLGTALGDALGLPMEGLTAKQIARRYGKVDHFVFAGSMGFISDDTEQSALLARAIALNPDDVDGCVEDFKRALLGWFLRLPCGIGMATAKACLNILFKKKKTGVNSAGNGSAMRAAVIGVYFHESESKRKEYGKAICQVTHTDPRAVAAALFVAELAAACTRNTRQSTCRQCFDEVIETVDNPSLKEKLLYASRLAEQSSSTEAAAKALGNSGFVIQSVPLALFCFLRFGDSELMDALNEVISAGGDTDSNAAILGAWLGAKKGEKSIDRELIDGIAGPFGPAYLRRLARFLSRQRRGNELEEGEVEDRDEDPNEVPGYSWPTAVLHNFSFFFLVLIHLAIRLLSAITEARS